MGFPIIKPMVNKFYFYNLPEYVELVFAVRLSLSEKHLISGWKQVQQGFLPIKMFLFQESNHKQVVVITEILRINFNFRSLKRRASVRSRV